MINSFVRQRRLGPVKNFFRVTTPHRVAAEHLETLWSILDSRDT